MDMFTSARRLGTYWEIRHERESLFAFWDGNGKTKKAFPVLGTGTGNTRSHSRSSGREWEIQEIIPVVWEGNEKTQMSCPLNRTGTKYFKVLNKYISLLYTCSLLYKLNIFALKIGSLI